MKVDQLFEQQVSDAPVDPNGIGSVPNNNNVDYLGMRVLMKPSKFLDLAATTSGRQEAIDYLIDQMQQGNSVANPWLKIEKPENENEPFKVDGHEGRHRMMAIKQAYGDNPVEVHLFFKGEIRARHIKDWWIESMMRGIEAEEVRVVVDRPIERVLR